MSRSKLADAQVEQIRLSSLTDTHWANLLGVNRTTVERARTGRTHSHLSTPPRLQAAPRGGWKKLDIPCDFRPELISSAGEEWRPVVGWERHYRISNLGRVYSLHQTGRLLIGMNVNDGYHVIKVRQGDRKANLQIHCMVLEAFVGPRPPGYEGCHNDGNPENCRAENLRWDTPVANQADRLVHGTSLAGKHIPRKLTAERVREIRLHPQITLAYWASRFGCSILAVSMARNGRTWRDIDVPPIRKRA